MASKVQFGLSNFHIAFESDDSTSESPKWETPIHVPGSVSLTAEGQGEEYKFYADNMVYYSTHSDNGDSGDLEMAKFPDEILAEMHGWILDENGGLLEITNGKKKNFALMFQVETDITGRKIAYYRCNGGKPSTEYKTTEEGIEVQTQTMPVTMPPLSIGGKNIVKYSIEKNSTNETVYNNFFKAVYLPEGILQATRSSDLDLEG